MLDPRDEAFLAHAVLRGRIEQRRASELAARYRGRPGELPDALIQSGALSAADSDRLMAELSRSTPAPAVAPLAHAAPPSAAPPAGAAAAGVRSDSVRLPGWPEVPGYPIERVLGRGGMGAVYLAVQAETGRRVALKVLLNAGERQIARFERESEALARLRHPGIVELLDSGTQAGKPYLIMAYHEGGDLQQALEEGRLSPRQILEVGARIARALAFAHDQGILHRDLKPANVLLDEDGAPRLTDFGLAKIVDRETQLTKSNAALGTPHFMAPEQVRGAEYTPAVDSYGVGALLFLALTGELPFDGDRLELFAAILKRAPPHPWDLAEVDRGVGKLILWSLEKDPAERPSCAQIAEALERHLAGQPMHAAPPSMRRASVRRAATSLAFLLLLAVLGITADSLLDRRRRDAEARAAQAAIETLKEAAKTARRARGGRDLRALERELDAYLAVEEALTKVPAGSRANAVAQILAARKRHQAVLVSAIPLLLRAGRLEEAGALARRRVSLAPGPAAQVSLAQVLARRRETAGEAFVIATTQRGRSLDPAVRDQLAEVFLSLQRPATAYELLKDAGPSALRVRALEASGDLSAACADAREVEVGAPGDVKAAIARIRLEVLSGADPAAALTALAALEGGALPAWHLARGRAAEHLGRRAAARDAFVEAIKLDPALTRVLPRMYLRRGHRLTALRGLAKLHTPAARLDRAVARWVAGAPDSEVLDALGGVAREAAAFAASPVVSAAAHRWRARIFSAAQRHEEARTAATAAWDVDPGSRSAETLAWTNLRLGALAQARAALSRAAGRTPEGALVDGWIHLEAGDADAALQSLSSVPAGIPGRVALRLRLAKPDERPALARRLLVAWSAAPLGQPAPVPVGSEPGDAPTAWASVRLLSEARRLQAESAAPDDSQVGRRARLLRRAVGLEPSNLPAKLDLSLITDDLSAVSSIIAEHPALEAARRVRLRVRASRRRKRREVTPENEFLSDLRALGGAPRLMPGERASIASALWKLGGDVEGAWKILTPALSLPTRGREVYALAVKLANERGDSARAQRCERVLEEIQETRRSRAALYRDAFYHEDHERLPKALTALRRLGRDLPRTSDYWLFRAQAQFGQAAFGRANLSGGEYLLIKRGLSADAISMWIHGFGWQEDLRQDVVDELTAPLIESEPLDAAPWLGRAMFLAARYNLSKVKDREDLERAADLTLFATRLAPRSAGTLAFAANLLVTAGEGDEGLALVALAEAVDPGCQFATFQIARHAASQGDAQRAIQVVRRLMHLNRPKFTRQLRIDPIFKPILDDPDYQEFISKLPR